MVTYGEVEDVDYDFNDYDADKGEFVDNGDQGEAVFFSSKISANRNWLKLEEWRDDRLDMLINKSIYYCNIFMY